ncbi:glycosyltransferase family 2 protein [Gemella haemolysans]|uniref:glycosyltransferase family 2 protein n=1 Tax=Gemella haemolysans TaxID=1379 RepID=UPI001A62274F|nr:glycosyltransferase [Gemella haemolysans]VTX69886.1 putative glycosyltransferase EpsJ [Gemella haemolysans]
MKERISVIVPVYNVEKYLEKCVNSIVNQTYKNLEIILVDDGATDNSGKLCDELAKIDNRIKVYHKENGGLSDARNYGVERATGDYIGFVDSDDYIDAEMYEKLYEAIKKENADVAECNLKIIYPNRVELYTNEKYFKVCTKQEYLEEYLKIEKVFGSVWTKLIKSDIAKKLVFPKGKLYEDTYYAYDLINVADSYVIMDAPYYNYFMRENSITNAKFNLRIFDLIEIVEEFHNTVYENYPELEKAADCRKMYAYFSVLNSILLEDEFKNNSFYPQIVNYFKENYIKLLRNKYITRNRKLSILLIKININLYRRVLMKYKVILAGN